MDYKIDKNTKVILYGASAIDEIMKYKIENLGQHRIYTISGCDDR